MKLVSELDLPAFDYAAPDFSADRYHQQLAETRRLGWLAKSPLAYIVLDHDSGEFFRALSTSRDDIERAVIEVQQYVADLLEARRTAPGDDLISDLLSAREEKGEGEVGGGRLSADECVQLVVNLLAGGIDTTSAQLSHAIRLFASHPAQWELLAADRQAPDRLVGRPEAEPGPWP
jgi:cytochrome P450